MPIDPEKMHQIVLANYNHVGCQTVKKLVDEALETAVDDDERMLLAMASMSAIPREEWGRLLDVLRAGLSVEDQRKILDYLQNNSDYRMVTMHISCGMYIRNLLLKANVRFCGDEVWWPLLRELLRETFPDEPVDWDNPELTRNIAEILPSGDYCIPLLFV